VIARLTGTVLDRAAATVVVDVHGVGYLVYVTPGAQVPARGQEVTLHTSLQVREDSMTLYGFTTAAELASFELLLTSSGVGPKLALAALGTHRPEVLRTAIATGDEATLTAIPGVGRKVAQRLVLELKDKVGTVPVAASGVAGGGTAPVAVGALEEVRDALVSLGYSAGEITAALEAVAGSAAGDSAELLRAALRHLGSARAVRS
jgi:holliday junction DNA helicase RuvA